MYTWTCTQLFYEDNTMLLEHFGCEDFTDDDLKKRVKELQELGMNTISLISMDDSDQHSFIAVVDKKDRRVAFAFFPHEWGQDETGTEYIDKVSQLVNEANYIAESMMPRLH